MFSHYNNKWRHEKSCKYNKFTELENENKKLKLELEKTKNFIPNNINNQLIELIVNKTNTIQKLKTKTDTIDDAVINNDIDLVLKEKDLEIKLKNDKIKLLEDTYNKKQKRKKYDNNLIYLLTTPENLKNRIYILGKAKNLSDRLSTYNKTCEH